MVKKIEMCKSNLVTTLDQGLSIPGIEAVSLLKCAVLDQIVIGVTNLDPLLLGEQEILSHELCKGRKQMARYNFFPSAIAKFDKFKHIF